MIPQKNSNIDLRADFEEVIEPTMTNKILFEKDRCIGFTDEIEAMKQAIFLMLNIERYQHIIYSWNYGVEFRDLFGMPTSYVASEVPRRIRDCLMQDDRINEADSFEVTAKKHRVHVKYTAHTIFGDIELEKEVNY